MFYDDDLIIGRVPKKVKERTKENMEVYNMTLYDAFQEARALKSFANYMGSVVSHTKNEATDKAFDDAIQNLLDFEKEHGIK